MGQLLSSDDYSDDEDYLDIADFFFNDFILPKLDNLKGNPINLLGIGVPSWLIKSASPSIYNYFSANGFNIKYYPGTTYLNKGEINYYVRNAMRKPPPLGCG